MMLLELVVRGVLECWREYPLDILALHTRTPTLEHQHSNTNIRTPIQIQLIWKVYYTSTQIVPISISTTQVETRSSSSATTFTMTPARVLRRIVRSSSVDVRAWMFENITFIVQLLMSSSAKRENAKCITRSWSITRSNIN